MLITYDESEDIGSDTSDEMIESPRPALISITFTNQVTNQGKKSSNPVKSPANTEIVSLDEADK